VLSTIQDASAIELSFAQAIDLLGFIRWWLQAAVVQLVYLTVLFVYDPMSEQSKVTRLSV
jgi:hypothetical protein